MFWRITAYNGTVWDAPSQMSLGDALERFSRDTQLTEWDVREIKNLH